MFMGHGSQVSGKKIQNKKAENEISMTCYTPQHYVMKLAAAQFHCNFPLHHRLESFYRRFQTPSRLFSL